MAFNHTHYVPCLRWKQGEYQAVWRLRDRPVKHSFTPLIEAPEMGWDFEEEKVAKSVDEHLAPFAKRIYDKWGDGLCFVDLNLINPNERMQDGVHPASFVFGQLRSFKCAAVPVTGLHRDANYQNEIKKNVEKDRAGLCLRITLEEIAKNSFKDELNTLLSSLSAQLSDCDLIIDLGAPNFIPLDGFVALIQVMVHRIPHLSGWRTFTILGTSFPETMAGIKKEGELIARDEWQLYQLLIDSLGKAKLRLPTFGDYAIAHPKVICLDMRKVKPSATIRYTTSDYWYIVKGESVRDHDSQQYCRLSKLITDSVHFCRAEISWGDEYIQRCAGGSVSTKSLSMWRQVGTNHHIEKAAQDIANFFGSSSVP